MMVNSAQITALFKTERILKKLNFLKPYEALINAFSVRLNFLTLKIPINYSIKLYNQHIHMCLYIHTH